MPHILLVVIGIILFFFSLYTHTRFLGLVRKTSLGKWWGILLGLVAFFTLGYLLFAYWLIAGSTIFNINSLKTLVSLVFFFGAIFVVITISLIYSTVKALINEREEIRQLHVEKIALLQNKDVELEKKIQEKTRELENTKVNLEQEIDKQTKILQQKVKDLETLNKVMIGRELKMAELKEEVKTMKKKVGDA